MRSLTRWDPFSEISNMRRMMARVFDDTLFRPYREGDEQADIAFMIPLDVYQNKDELVVKASLPGLKAEDVNVSVEGNTLTIRGEHRDAQSANEENYLLRERRSGAFYRSITLPDNLQTEKVDATFEDGILTLHIPKVEEAKPKSITIKPVHHIESK